MDLQEKSLHKKSLSGVDQKKSGPFESLVKLSSLFVVLLFVAGFSFRWAYYYNFGFPSFVYSLNIEAVLINAFELIRTPSNLLLCVLFILLPSCVLSIGLHIFRRRFLDKKDIFQNDVWQRNKFLIIDLISAVFIIVLTFAVGSHIGYKTFTHDVKDNPSSKLPKVTVVFKDNNPDYKFPLCGGLSENVRFIGNGHLISNYSKNNEGCNSNDIVWRLLHKDSNDVYIFGSRKGEVAKDKKPIVIVIPSSNIFSLILNR